MEMTLEKLKSYKDLKQSMTVLKRRFEEFRNTAYTENSACYGNSVIYDYGNGYPKPQSVVGFDVAEYDRKYEDYEKRVDSLKGKIESIEKWISEIENETTRYVFEMYYLEGKKWSYIAKELGYAGNEHYPRLYIRDAYLKEKGIKIEKK